MCEEKGGPVLRGPWQLQFLQTLVGAGSAALSAKAFVIATLVWYMLGEVSLESETHRTHTAWSYLRLYDRFTF